MRVLLTNLAHNNDDDDRGAIWLEIDHLHSSDDAKEIAEQLAVAWNEIAENPNLEELRTRYDDAAQIFYSGRDLLMALISRPGGRIVVEQY